MYSLLLALTFFQLNKSERALEALRNLSSPRALVIRDGKERRIAGREVVRGDILLLREGDCVPADAILLECENFSADESLLTGESVPVTKILKNGTHNFAINSISSPGGNDLPFVYSGTLVVAGFGIAQVLAVGANTEIGKIGKALKTIKNEKTKLQLETNRIG